MNQPLEIMDNSSVESGERNGLVTHIVAVQRMLQYGLELPYITDQTAWVENLSTEIDQFITKFGIQPVTLACCMRIFKKRMYLTMQGSINLMILL
jgi:hypothetical protein